jgi:hypothetical protein
MKSTRDKMAESNDYNVNKIGVVVVPRRDYGRALQLQQAKSGTTSTPLPATVPIGE